MFTSMDFLAASFQLMALVSSMLFSRSEVCYPDVGCFGAKKPYDNSAGYLPEPLSTLNNHIILYTRQNPFTGFRVKYKKPEKFLQSNFDPSRGTKFIIHGFGESIDIPWFRNLKDAILEKNNVNVFLVGWGYAARMPNYFQAVANLRIVAAEVYLVIQMLQKLGAPLSSIHLIGHSLGSHLSGEVGRRSGGLIGQISGLDPAGPTFVGRDPTIRLDPTDAIFVDVMHTNGDPPNLIMSAGTGVMEPLGHVDFYVNGGKRQPSCAGMDGILGAWHEWFFSRKKRAIVSDVIDATIKSLGCSHAMSLEYYLESIQSDCPFTSYACFSYEQFEGGLCNTCLNNNCNSMGFHASPKRALGKLYLDTNLKTPYCKN